MSGPVWHASGDVDARAAELSRWFTLLHGRPPAGVWAAPGRVNLVGEHVDYAGGLCLPLALPHTTLVAAAGDPRGRVVVRSRQRPDEPVDVAVSEVGPGSPAGWGAYVAGVASVLEEVTGAGSGGLLAAVDSEVPVGAGLSSSAALSCATALAVDELVGLGLADDDAGRARLAEVCVRAENEVAQAATGGMDQAAALRCSAGHALLLDCRDGSARQVPFAPEAHGLGLLVIDTRTEHSHADGQYAQRRAGCDEAARALGVMSLRDVAHEPLDAVLDRLTDERLHTLVRHVVTEIGRVERAVELLTDGGSSDPDPAVGHRDHPGVDPAAGPAADPGLVRLGWLLDASHASLRDDYRVSCRELDLAVDSAREAGARGARMTGGGFGGSAIALVPLGLMESVAEHVDETFRAQGLRAPVFVHATPSAAGRRVA